MREEQERRREVEKLTKKILKEIPRDLLELVYSEGLPLRLVDICSDCGVEEEKDLEKVGIVVGKVLYGGLSPEKLLDALKKEAEFPPLTATKIFSEIDGQIFSSIRGSLNKLYKKKKKFERLSLVLIKLLSLISVIGVEILRGAAAMLTVGSNALNRELGGWTEQDEEMERERREQEEERRREEERREDEG